MEVHRVDSWQYLQLKCILPLVTSKRINGFASILSPCHWSDKLIAPPPNSHHWLSHCWCASQVRMWKTSIKRSLRVPLSYTFRGNQLTNGFLMIWILGWDKIIILPPPPPQKKQKKQSHTSPVKSTDCNKTTVAPIKKSIFLQKNRSLFIFLGWE